MSELNELYLSIVVRTFALSMIGIFIPIYLHQLGFSFVQIALYYMIIFLFRIVLNVLAGVVTARYGPKHTLSYSHVLILVSLGLLLTMPQFNWPLWLLAFAVALQASFNFIAYHVDFSKIKEVEDEGAELSRMYLLQRIASAVGPLFGGLIAVLLGIEFVLMLSILLSLVAIWPLMMSGEPMKPQKSLSFRGISLRREFRNIISFSATTTSRQINLALWPLYISAFIFTSNVYGMVGLVTSIAVVSALVMAKIIAKLIDNNKGGQLLTISAWLLAVVNASRVFVSSFFGVVGVNIASESSEAGVFLPTLKGFYDRADSAKDRIAYIVMMESSSAFLRALFWLVVALLLANLDAQLAFQMVFVLVAVITPFSITQNFKTLKRAKT